VVEAGVKMKQAGPQRDRPDNRRMIHVGAPVASQQTSVSEVEPGRILRVDHGKVTAAENRGNPTSVVKDRQRPAG
jgi:hypothetical protein